MSVVCHKCAFYYVTWDPAFPHGCRGMGFKSRRYPITDVRRVMNHKDCLLFNAKKAGHHQQVKKTELNRQA
jgi:hypothetical protein